MGWLKPNLVISTKLLPQLANPNIYTSLLAKILDDYKYVHEHVHYTKFDSCLSVFTKAKTKLLIQK